MQPSFQNGSHLFQMGVTSICEPVVAHRTLMPEIRACRATHACPGQLPMWGSKIHASGVQAPPQVFCSTVPRKEAEGPMESV